MAKKQQAVEPLECPVSGGCCTISRVGQQPPAVSDEVVVRATLVLPATVGGLLIEYLRFGTRAAAAGQQLGEGWGYCVAGSDRPGRSRSCDFAASTWAAASRLAAAWGRTELSLLRHMIERRRAALVAAESPEEG